MKHNSSLEHYIFTETCYCGLITLFYKIYNVKQVFQIPQHLKNVS